MVKKKIFSEKIMNKVEKREKDIKEKLNNIKNYNILKSILNHFCLIKKNLFFYVKQLLYNKIK